MSIKLAAKVFGVVFVLIGILGFVPPLVPNGRLLGIFEVDVLHNLIHLGSGIAALAMSGTEALAKLYFKIFAVIYGLVTLLGFFTPDTALLGIIAHNVADLLLHLVITAAAVYFGYIAKPREATA